MTDLFSFQPELKGEAISVRPLRESDYTAVFACAGDKKIWEGHPSKNRYKEPEFKLWFKNAMDSGATVVVTDNATNELIGSSRFYVEDSDPNDISIGFTFLACHYWGGKTNYQLKSLQLDYAFGFFDIVWFHISPTNIRSQKATEKIGGVFIVEKDSTLSGKAEPWLFYKIEKSDWVRSQALTS